MASSTRPTVLVAGPLPPPLHGAARITRAVVDALGTRAPEGHDVRAISTAGAPGATGLRYHLTRGAAHLRAAAALVCARRAGPVQLYLGGAGGAGLWYQLGLVLVARAVRAPVTFHHHSYGCLRGRRDPAMVLLARALGPSGTHVCLSPGMADELRARYRTASQVVVVSNARFVEPAAHRRPVRGDGRRLVHVSNLSVEKGSVRVLEVLGALRARGLDAELTLVGPIVDRRVEAALGVARAEHPGAVRHVGAATPDEVTAELDAADVFVFPSTYRLEAQPMVVVEALARGVPVVATDRGAMRDLLPAEWLVTELGALTDRVAAVLAGDRVAAATSALALHDRSRRTGVDLVTRLLRRENG